MSAEKKISHVKQRRKSPCNLVVIHDVTHQNGGTSIHGPSSPPYNHSNTPSSLHTTYESSPNLTSDSKDGTSRKMSVSSDDTNSWASTPVRRSHTESEISAHLQKTSFLTDSGDLFYGLDFYGSDKETSSLHRPVTIEEELYSKVNQINSLVLLWRKRWKQQKDHSDLLSKLIQSTEMECKCMVDNVKELYSEKLKQARRELSKEIVERQKVEREKNTMEVLYKKAVQQNISEKEKLYKIIQRKNREVEQGQSLHNEARINIKDLKKELSKVKRDNEKLVRHIAKLRDNISYLETNIEKKEKQNGQICNGNCEHKILFDLAIQRLRFYENNDSTTFKPPKRRNDPFGSKYTVMSDPEDPVNISIEKTYSSTIESLDLDIPSDYIHNDSTITGRGSVEFKGDILPCLSPDSIHVKTERDRKLSSCSKDSAVIESHDSSRVSGDINHGSHDSLTSDSALSTEEYLRPPHLPLKKSLTVDTVNSLHAVQKPNLARRTTWTPTDTSPPDSGNCSPKISPREGTSEGDISSHLTPRSNAISVFEGLRERRNGIIDMDREVSLQLQMGMVKKNKDFSDLLKKFSFAGSHGDSATKETSGTEKKNFMNINIPRFSRKRHNHVHD